jgi:hypothetical protein
MLWRLAHHAHPEACRLADDHYSRKTVGAPQMMPPGKKLVLLAPGAVWGTSWPQPELVAHAWPGAWICTIFRRERDCPSLASDLILDAVAATRWRFGEPPPLGMVTWIQPKKVKPTKVRGRDVWGWVYRKAGFIEDEPTKGGYLTLRLPPEAMPPPCAPLGAERLQWETMALPLAG